MQTAAKQLVRIPTRWDFPIAVRMAVAPIIEESLNCTEYDRASFDKARVECSKRVNAKVLTHGFLAAGRENRAGTRRCVASWGLSHLAGNGAASCLVRSSRTLEEPMHEAKANEMGKPLGAASHTTVIPLPLRGGASQYRVGLLLLLCRCARRGPPGVSFP